MALEVHLEIEKADLLWGEDTSVRLVLKNTGDKPLAVADPEGGGMPVYRVVQLALGAETFFRSRPLSDGGADRVEIPAGGVHEASVPLLRDIRWPAPGDFAVSAVVTSSDGRQKGESQVVQVKVRPLAVRNLFLDLAHSDYVNGVFINPAADPPDLVVARFAIKEGGGLSGIEPVGKASPLARPVKSLAARLKPGSGEWIGWLEPRLLHVLHWDPIDRVAVEGSLKTAAVNAQLVPPLFIEPRSRGVRRSNGSALVWGLGEAQGGTTLHSIRLQASDKAARAEIDATLVVPGPRPEWSMSYAPAEGPRRLVYISSTNGRLRLFGSCWPGAQATAATQPLREWRGQLLAAGATLGQDDVLRGALLLWKGVGDGPQLELAGWTLSKDNRAEESFRQAVAWGVGVPPAVATVKVRMTGVPAVLLLRQENEWLVHDGFEQPRPVPPPFATTSLALDYVFFGLREVVLIGAQFPGGFAVKRLDGTDLPPRAGK